MTEFVQKYTNFKKPLEEAIYLDYPCNMKVMAIDFSRDDKYLAVGVALSDCGAIKRHQDEERSKRNRMFRQDEKYANKINRDSQTYRSGTPRAILNTVEIEPIPIESIFKSVETPEEYAVKIWDAYTGECVHTLPQEEWILTLKYSPDGTMLATGGFFGSLKLWDTTTWECIHQLQGIDENIKELDFSGTGGKLVTVSSDSMLRIWDTKTGECLSGGLEIVGLPLCIAHHPSKSQCIVGTYMNSVAVWNTDTMKCEKVWYMESKYPRQHYTNYQISYINNGEQFCTSGKHIWDSETLEYVRSLSDDLGGKIQFSPSDPTYIKGYSEYPNYGLVVWDMEENKKLKLLTKGRGKSDDAPISFTYNHAGDTIAGGYEHGVVRIWRVRQPKEKAAKAKKK